MAYSRDVIAVYEVEADHMEEAAQAIALGQTIGNPTVRTAYDSSPDVRRCLPKRVAVKGNRITIVFPQWNFSRYDGLNHFLTVLIGGQCDIGSIKKCRLVELELGEAEQWFPGPRHGIHGIRSLLGVWNRPLICGIVKPKIGLKPDAYANLCQQLADGGVDLIKEDEILANQPHCPVEPRVKAVVSALKGYKVLYMVSVAGDGSRLLDKARMAQNLGAGAIHANIWNGLGAYVELRRQVTLPIHYQKSGDRVFLTGPFSIAPTVWYQLVKLAGCDLGHIGMWGGYLSESEDDLKARQQAMAPMLPSFSCGATPELVAPLVEHFGQDILISSGGALCGHPEGPTAGAKAFRKAVEDLCSVPV